MNLLTYFLFQLIGFQVKFVLDDSYAKHPVCVGSYFEPGLFKKELKVIFEKGIVVSEQLLDRTIKSNENSVLEMDDAVKFFSEKCELMFKVNKK